MFHGMGPIPEGRIGKSRGFHHHDPISKLYLSIHYSQMRTLHQTQYGVNTDFQTLSVFLFGDVCREFREFARILPFMDKIFVSFVVN
jgi:hypothetical protein